MECKHLDYVKTASQCVIDYYCAYCGEWLGDKDVS